MPCERQILVYKKIIDDQFGRRTQTDEMLADQVVFGFGTEAGATIGPSCEKRGSAGASYWPFGQLEATDQILRVGYAQLGNRLRAEIPNQQCMRARRSG